MTTSMDTSTSTGAREAAGSNGASADPHASERAREQLLAAARKVIADVTAARGSVDPIVAARALRRSLETIEAGERGGDALPVATPESLLATWAREGPLVHEPTGIETLDGSTGGGLVYGSRIYVIGAPDAGKTALVVQIGAVYAARGIHVGILAVDEEPTDILTRLAQREGHEREAIEGRSPGSLARMRYSLAGLPLRMYDSRWTIEGAARDLATAAGAARARACLLIDSIQTVRCEAEALAERELGLAAAVELRTRAVRAAASSHGLIAIATSEMGRAGYRSTNDPENIDPLASAKWSSAIEYSGRVIVSLRSIRGVDGVIRAELIKNKHGRQRLYDRDPGEDRAIYLRLDRPRQTLTECARPSGREGDEDEARDAARSAVAEDRARRDAARVAQALARAQGLTARDLRAAVPGVGSRRVDAAVALLVGLGAVARATGARGRVGHHLDGRHVPDDVIRHLPPEDRAKVSWARPPAADEDDDGDDDGGPGEDGGRP